MSNDLPPIESVIAHRPPFLFVDRIVNYCFGRIQVEKTVRVDEFFFGGHFPNRPIMPGVLIIEIVAQASGALLHLDLGGMAGAPSPGRLGSIENFRFQRVVSPGDVLTATVHRKEQLGKMHRLHGELTCRDEPVARGHLLVRAPE